MELVDIPFTYILAGLFGWLLFSIFFVWRPEFIAVGILTFFFFSNMILYVALGGKHIPFGQIIVLLFGPLLFVAVAFKQRSRVGMKNLFPFIGMVIAFILSIIWNGLDFWGLKSALNPLLAGVFVYLAISEWRELRMFVAVFLLLAFANNILAGLQYAGFDNLYLPYQTEHVREAAGFRRGVGVLGHFMEEGMICAAVIPIAMMTFLEEKKKWLKLVWAVVLVSAIAGITFSVLRAALGGVVIGSLLTLLLWRGLKALPVILGSVAFVGILVVAVPTLNQSSSALMQHSSVADESAMGRPAMALAGLKLWMDSPIFGGGPGTLSRKISGGQVGRANIHNSYVTALADYGIVGFVFFMAILVLPFFRIRSAIRKFPESRGLLLGFTGALVAIYIIALLHPVDTNISFWIIVAMVLATSRFRPAPPVVRR